MTAHDDLTAAWQEWQTATLFKTWAKANPGELKRLTDYRYEGTPRPTMLTATGRALVDETAAWLATQPVADVGWEAWTVTELLNQKDPDSPSAPGDHPTFGWTKSARPAPGYPQDWQTQGYLSFRDYPDELVLVCRKQFLEGQPGVTTNFHLTGDDPVPTHNGVSPILGQWHPNEPWQIMCKAEGDGTDNKEHWTIALPTEISRTAVYEEQWHIRWRTDRTGYIHLTVLQNGAPWKQIRADNIRTQYVEQKPQAFIWVGGYESSGLTTIAKTRVTLDRRGRTLTEALADTPRYGSQAHSISTVGGPPSTVIQNGTL